MVWLQALSHPLRNRSRTFAPARQAAIWCLVGAGLIFSQMWMMLVTGPTTDAPTSELVRNLFIPAYALIAATLVLQVRAVGEAIMRMPLTGLLVGLAFASTLWSIAPDITVRRAAALLFTTLAGVSLGALTSWRELARALGLIYIVTAVASVAVALLLPRYGIMQVDFPGAWRGVWYEKNGLGNHMTQGFLFCAAAAFLSPKQGLRWAVGSGLCLGLVLMSQSKTALLGALMGAAFLLLVFVCRRGAIWALFGGYLAIVLGGTVVLVLLIDQGLLLSLVGKDASLTGRTQVWAALQALVDQKRWLGYGYGVIWSDTSIWGPMRSLAHRLGFHPQQAHSTLFEIELAGGYVGASLWILILVLTTARAARLAFKSPGAYLALPFVAMFVVSMQTETLAMSYNDLFCMAFIAIASRLATPLGSKDLNAHACSVT